MSFISLFSKYTSFTRSIALLIIVAHGMLVLSPAVAAVREEVEEVSSRQALSPDEELSEAFAEAVRKLALLKQLRSEGKEVDVVISELSILESRIETLNAQVIKDFDDVGTGLAEKQLSDVIHKRHNDFVVQYNEKYQSFMSLLQAETDTGVIASVVRTVSGFVWGDDSVVSDQDPSNVVGDFSTNDFERSHQEFDSENLPNKALQPDLDNKPKTSKDEFIQSHLFNSPLVQLAALGDFKFDQLENASDPVYLSETDEVVLTQAIQDKAEELEYDPVKIYHWVRNNIEWLPSWGAIQNSDLTLGSRRGNAMDIASLTIALLRASGIPARYVHGTIEVTEDRYKNWVGNFDTTEAAGNFASSGGIPSAMITSGGQISKVQMEHVWVEAAIDFQPSRGAKNRDADTWVSLDAAYKQYEYLEGLDVVGISGLDVEQLAQDFTDSGTVNEAEGWATGFDATILQQAQTQAQEKLEAHIGTLTDPTVGDVIGGRKTIIKEYPTLPSSVPNRILVEGARYDKLPAALQQSIEFAFQRDILGEVIDASHFPWATLNSEKVTLSFKPATEADEQALLALIPEGITDISQLPSSIPSYLMNVIPELKVNGVTVKTGSPMRLGEELDFITGIRLAGRGYAQPPRTYKVIAGSFLHANVFAGSVSPLRLEQLQSKLEVTKAILESGDEAQIGYLTREELLGDMFYAGGMGYYAQLLALSYMSGLQSGGHYQLAAGYGTVGYEPQVNSFFGIPRGIKTGGVAFDIPIIHVSGVKDGNADSLRQYVQQVGVISSALEHLTPEQMFAPADANATQPDAISAVKALQKASAVGQRIYQITQANMSEVLPLITIDSDAKAEIRSALSVGKEVTTHTDAVSILGGWSGFGYIILDPVTGDGAYKISGGSNGSFLKWVDENSVSLGVLALGLSFGPGAIGLLGLFLGLVIALASMVALIESMDGSPCQTPAVEFYRWLTVGLGVLGVIFSRGSSGNTGNTFASTLAIFVTSLIYDGAIRGTFDQHPACQGGE